MRTAARWTTRPKGSSVTEALPQLDCASYTITEGRMHARARAVLSAVFAEHLGVDPTCDMRPDVIAAAIIAAMDVATGRWAAGAGDRNTLLSEALMILRTSLTAPLESKERQPRRSTAKTSEASE